ncbi:hypothetical protein JCM10212_006653 [Sporobolomyces blumeae]
MTSLYANPIPFDFFAQLVDRLSNCTARRKGSKPKGGPSRQVKLVQKWIEQVKEVHQVGQGQPLPDGAVVIFFRLLFPEESVRRRYGLQEYTFAKLLEKYYRVPEGRFSNWAAPSEGSRSRASGCLGEEVRRWMESKGKKGNVWGPQLTFGRLDELLDELASNCEYSADEVRQLRDRPGFRLRSTFQIVAEILAPLNPSQTALVIQLILRDLSPLLYSPPSSSASISLLDYVSTCYDRVDLHHTMPAWHARMPDLYRAVADLDSVSWTVEAWMRSGKVGGSHFVPRLGVPVKVPKTEKPGTCARTTRHLSGPVAVETKYDGERLQIHIDTSLPEPLQIKIFSKSGRDSTQTRHRLLPITRAAVGLPFDRFGATSHPLLASRLFGFRPLHAAPTKLILEGEMVPFNEDEEQIDEFWKLNSVKTGREDPAPRGRSEQDSIETGGTGATPSPRRGRGMSQIPNLHLMVVWFDMLLVGDESLLETSYQERRARLESLIRPIPGFSMLAESVLIDFDHASTALDDLRARFAKIIVDRCEGLMLKPLGSRYNDAQRGQKWVKLKKDFIPGAGDTLDFVIVGASWQKERARELLVPPSVYTTFFVGLEANELGAQLHRSNKKHYHILFSVSYGLDRKQLGDLCHSIRQNQPQRFDLDGLAPGTFREAPGAKGRYKVYDSACTSFTFSIASHLMSVAARPTVIFPRPREVELNGAGFQRSPGCPYYELRWPRYTKVSRIDAEPLTLSALQRTAVDAMQRCPDKTASQVVQDLFDLSRASASPGKTRELDAQRYERDLDEWLRRLERADGIERISDPATTAEGRGILASEPCPYGSTPVARSTVDKAPHATTPTAFAPPSTPPRRESAALTRTVSSPVAAVSSTAPASSSHEPPRSVPISRRSTSIGLLTTRRTALQFGTDDNRASSARPSKRRRSVLSPTTTRILATTARGQPLVESTRATAGPVSPSSPSSNPFTSHSWTVFPPLPATSVPPDPLHPFLDDTNYLSDARSVLWLAGIATDCDGRSCEVSRRRQGYIFVSEGAETDAADWIENVEHAPTGGPTATVWLVRRAALEERGLYDLGLSDDVLSII